ncbi:MAG: GNAT family N-acetyltransferase [Candidatus Aminicenantes bacterium]|nr:GNAT family N-acetyltransferase [Candidatus Aminicenantes bacterium]
MNCLRSPVPSDLPVLKELWPRLSDAALEAQIRGSRIRIIQAGGKPVGFLKTHVIWESLPFIELIVIRESERGHGYGTRAVREWERQMADLGFDLVVMSTQAAATAQHFWRKLGYRDCGALTIRDQPAEIFMQRRLTGDS